MSEDKLGVNTITSISSRLIMPGLWSDAYPSFKRLTPAEQARRREQREKEWWENRSRGLVPLIDKGEHCYECGGTVEWTLAENPSDHVDKWVSADDWNVYLFAKHVMDVALEGLEPE